MISAGNMTKEQIEAALAGLHVSANVKTTYVPQKVTVPQTITEEAMVSNGSETVMVPGPDGEWIEQQVQMKKKITRTYDAGTVEVDGVVPKYEIEGTEGEGGITTAFSSAPDPTPSHSSTTSGKNSGGGGGGGGGKVSKSNKSAQRYKTVDEKIGDADRKANDAKSKIERSYGKDQDKAIKELLKANNDKKKLLNDKLTEAQGYLDDDKSALKDAAADLDIKFTFDKEGNITNYKKTMEDLYEDLDQLEEKANADGKATDKEKAEIDALKEKIETLEDAMSTYDDTREIVQDLLSQIEELAGMPPLPVVTSDLIDIYKEVNDELDDIETKISRISGEAERLTGGAKIKKLKEAAKLEKEKLKTLEEQQKINAKD